MTTAPPSKPRASSYTGRTRRHTTRWSVRASDFFARWLITIGGIGTIVAVLTVFVFLTAVVAPLFWPGASLSGQVEVKVPWINRSPLRIGVNEYQSLGWALFDNGDLLSFRMDTGAKLFEQSLLDNDQQKLTAASFSAVGSDVVLGFADGTVKVGSIGFGTSFLELKDAAADLKSLADDAVLPYEQGLAQRTPQGQIRVQAVKVEFSEPQKIADSPIRLLDHVTRSQSEDETNRKGPVIAAWTEDRQVVSLTTKFNLAGNLRIDETATWRPEVADSDRPLRVLISAQGDNVFLPLENGRLLRFDSRDLSQVKLAETVALLDEKKTASKAGPRLTVCEFILGRETILCGDSNGGLNAWFRVRQPAALASANDDGNVTPIDGHKLTLVHRLKAGTSEVTALSISQRSRLVTAGFSDGSLAVYHVTTENRLVKTKLPPGNPAAVAVRHVVMLPRNDGLLAATNDRLTRFQLDPKHPEATLSSLFLPVWYEGYDRPMHIWQSSFAGVEPEMKLGLWPLVFGTLKATFFSLMFGAPIAFATAIYTSEFMQPAAKAKIKPTIEMMASLPSVVLGFMAGIVIAPFVEGVVPAVLTCFITVPLCLILGAFLWQLLPSIAALYGAPYRILLIGTMLAAGLGAGVWMGDFTERLLFAGDIMRWLNGQIGTGLGGWFLILLPLLAVGVGVAVSAFVNPWLRIRCGEWSRGQFAAVNFLKFVAGTVFVCLLTYALAWLITTIGLWTGWDLDPRGSLLDTYVQRNALVVGFVMGFAIIPIIYTIADDALSTVPQHLRSASLGAGATPWQTTVRVVVPTAMSGLFSALMIGLGRAVGETMIVLMAGGNTPITSWNIFNGFRTLAANLAVELPEAVPGSTHMRTLFLAALTLFCLTFVVNTVAELIRLRFRRRAYQL